MLNFTLRRLIGMLPLLFLISIVAFSLAKLMPGDALTGMIDPTNTKPEYIAEMRELLGYNDSIISQYWKWLIGAFQGDFGQSFIHKMPVIELLGQRLGNTLLLAVTSILVTYTLSYMMGLFSGKRPGTLADDAIIGFNYFAYAIPTFVLSIVALYVFAIKLDWLPISGTISIGVEDGTLDFYMSKLYHTILPAIVLGGFSTAAYTQFLRNDIIESSRKDYVRTAMAKGTPESRIYNRHILRNSMIPMVTFIGLDLGGLLGGAVIVETIFTYPGVGSLFIASVSNRDYSVVMTITLLLSVTTLIGNLVSDLLYGLVDPRIRIR